MQLFLKIFGELIFESDRALEIRSFLLDFYDTKVS